MNNESIGAMISRAAGVVLIVIGVSFLLLYLPLFQRPDTAVAGWTSHSQQVNFSSLHLHDSYFLVGPSLNAWPPGVVQAAVGLMMVLLSRPVGRWLARGLNQSGGSTITEPSQNR